MRITQPRYHKTNPLWNPKRTFCASLNHLGMPCSRYARQWVERDGVPRKVCRWHASSGWRALARLAAGIAQGGPARP